MSGNKATIGIGIGIGVAIAHKQASIESGDGHSRIRMRIPIATPIPIPIPIPKEAKMLTIGSPAPRFTARTQDGRIVRLDDYAGKKSVVLYFFSREGTPG